MTDVATEAQDEPMTDTTQPEPEPTITDTERELRAELAAAERRLVEQGEQVAQYEAAERARAGTELVAVGDTPDQSKWQFFRQCAHELALASVIPSGLRRVNADETAANVLTVILHGHDVGLGPIAAMNLINIIEGKPAISGPGMAALITGRGHSLEFDEEYDDAGKISAAICKGTRRDTGASITMRFTRQDAIAAGLCQADESCAHGVKARGQKGGALPWEKYTPDMLRWRALSRVSRMLFGDVMAGIGYTPEELRPDVIDVEATEVGAPPQDHGEPMSSEQRAEMNRRVQAMSPDGRRLFFATLKARALDGELPKDPKNLGADHYLTLVSILDEIAPSPTPGAGTEHGDGPAPGGGDDTPSDAVIVVHEAHETDDTAPAWCVDIQLADPGEAAQEGDDEPLRTFTNDAVAVGQVVEIEEVAWRVLAVWPFDERPM